MVETFCSAARLGQNFLAGKGQLCSAFLMAAGGPKPKAGTILSNALQHVSYPVIPPLVFHIFCKTLLYCARSLCNVCLF